MNVVASIFISIAAIWDYWDMMNEEGISFPTSFSVAFNPDTLEVGIAFLVAGLAGDFPLSFGMYFLCFEMPRLMQ